jgi:uncharacterized protein (DUF486 family)
MRIPPHADQQGGVHFSRNTPDRATMPRGELRITLNTRRSTMRGTWTIVLLVLSNLFMTLAWYGHLRFKDHPTLAKAGLFTVILISWGIAFFEYCLQVPANRLGYADEGGPFSLVQLKVIQEVITLVVFVGFSLVMFKNEAFRWNHALAGVLLVAAVWLVFKK